MFGLFEPLRKISWTWYSIDQLFLRRLILPPERAHLEYPAVARAPRKCHDADIDFRRQCLRRTRGQALSRLAPDLASVLMLYSWLTNVLQLKNTLYRAMGQREESMLCGEDIDRPSFSQALPLTDNLLDNSLDDISKRFERSILTYLYGAYSSTRKLAKQLKVYPILLLPINYENMV